MLPRLGQTSVTLDDAAGTIASLYERTDEFERQKQIMHLGLIATEVDGASHSRYEYVMLQCALADILDRLHKGAAAQGAITIDGTKYFGNAVLKAWFLLSNFGHTRFTYGDEKTLALYALKRPGFRTKLLTTIRSQPLRDHCQRIIDDFAFSEFHFVLAAYRIYKEQPRRIEDQNWLALLLELLLLKRDDLQARVNDEKLLQLKELFRKVRAIAIVAVDGHYSHLPMSIDLMSSLVSFDEIEGGVLGQDITSRLAPLKSQLYDQVYLAPAVLACQRSYETQALCVLSEGTQNNERYETTLEKAFRFGLLPDHTRSLIPFCRFEIHPEIQPETSFYNEFRNITVRSKRGCPSVEGYLDSNPCTGTRYADFFISDSFTDSDLPKFLSNVCQLIEDQALHMVNRLEAKLEKVSDGIRLGSSMAEVDEDAIDSIIRAALSGLREDAWRDVDMLLLPAYQALTWAVMRYFVPETYRFCVTSKAAPYPVIGMAFDDMSSHILAGTVLSAIEHEEPRDPARAQELAMLLRRVKRRHKGFTMACLARVDILDMSKPPSKRSVTDIDSMILRVSETEMQLELFEAKLQKKSGETDALRDLRKNLAPVLRKGTSYRTVKVSGLGAKLVISRSSRSSR